jgi:hypothetical protein
MDLVDEIKNVFDELRESLPTSEDITEKLDESYEKIISLICNKNKNMYMDLIHQMTAIPISKITEKSS